MKDFIQKLLGTILGIVLVFLLLYLGIKLQTNHKNNYPWTGSIFTENTVINSKEFKSSTECIDWINNQKEDLNHAYENWDYNCGYKCDFKDQNIKSGKLVNTLECEKVIK